MLFRATCYYYRKAYYRSYFLDPPACAVGELRGNRYRGETAFPLVLQNLHRYLFYITFLYLPFLWSDVVHATRFGGSFGVGIGTLVILANTTALTLYSFSCHSARHLIGGSLDCFSCSAGARTRHAAWKGASALNARHMLFAWMSFFTVCSADLYVRLVASGVIHDIRLL
ncbi:MAG: succinate dehydrogenase [Deltaproteobacteria bacterium]|nr:MAG: succinate dehydrogenase [Deltaproteobacteria bacterium]